MAISAFVSGVLLGLGAAAPIGPVNIEMTRRALSRGWLHGVTLGLGAVSIDVVYAAAAVAGVSVAARSPYVFWPIAVAGILLLLYLAFLSLRSAHRALRTGWQFADTVDGPPPRLSKVYLTGLAMTATNPMTLAFWFGGLSSQALSSQGAGESLPTSQLAILAAGVFVGALGWCVCFSAVMAYLGRYRKPWWMAAADLAGGLVLLGFAVFSALQAVQRLR